MNNKNLFFWKLGELKVEDQVYKLPTSYLARKSTKFNDLLGRQANGSAANGGSNKISPVQLDGVSKVDFETFLSVVLEFKVEPAFHSDEDWMVVLKLANLWGFGELRKIAIETLTNSQTAGWSATDYVLFGRQFEVEKWVHSGYSQLVERSMKVTEAEAEEIGWKTALKLGHVREDIAALKGPGRAGSVPNDPGHPDPTSSATDKCDTPASPPPKFSFEWPKVEPFVWKALVDRAFQVELKSLREVGAVLDASPPVSEKAPCNEKGGNKEGVTNQIRSDSSYHLIMTTVKEPYSDMAIFEVEGQLYRTSTTYLRKHSAIFHDLFELPPSSEAGAEGQSTESPIRLEGVSGVDFERFLSVVNELKLAPVNRSANEWRSVLKLANLWGLRALRKLVIDTLSQWTNLPAVYKIQAGRNHKVEEWVRTGYKSLIERKEKLSEREAEALGWTTALKICHLREDYRGQPGTLQSPAQLSESSFTETFGEELDDIRKAEDALNVPPPTPEGLQEENQLVARQQMERNMRVLSEEIDASLKTQISILESLRQRLGSGEAIPDAEVSRLLKLAKAQEERTGEQQGTEVIEWKTVFSRVKQDQHGDLNEWDRKDLAKIMKELEADATSKGG
ncbi:hypothetical protein ONZ45_g13035 [Pleurotus djamor]|nr:hypothetical protein ONZ45_g13035 [Pleurotus djamor]